MWSYQEHPRAFRGLECDNDAKNVDEVLYAKAFEGKDACQLVSKRSASLRVELVQE